MSKLQPVRGTKDILFTEQKKFQAIVDIARLISSRFGYQEAAIPIFEFTEVFTRTLGDYSDIVNKEMYTFPDRNGQNITLRPEFTAGIARAVISNGLYNEFPLKFFSAGPVFRYERPQHGRMRQFHQINCEYIGVEDPLVDIEVIDLANMILSKLGLIDVVSLEINTLGDRQSRSHYLEKLIEYFRKYHSSLSEDSKIRLEKNPLRILDSKDEMDKKISHDAPSILDYLTNDSKQYFEIILDNLTKIGIKYNVNKKMVRGLDYYNHTTFEFITDKLGAQGTVLGGGRYDGLLKIMGGQDAPGIGFAAGIERISELYNYQSEARISVSIIALEKDLRFEANKVAHALRAAGINSEIENTYNLSKAMKKALNREATYAIFIGEEEIKKQRFKLKNFSNRQESEFDLSTIINLIKKNEF
jgi:histidyl-tRNA synthetase